MLTEIFRAIMIVSFFQMFVILPMGCDLSIFNPIANYKRWYKINWFGVIVATLLLNMVFILYAICYWTYKGIVLFCVLLIGRK